VTSGMTSAIIDHHRDVLTLAVSRDNSLAHPRIVDQFTQLMYNDVLQ
jgi:hypothetical protein